MNQQSTNQKYFMALPLKIGLFFWMCLIVSVYLILFGPPEFWALAQRVGFQDLLYKLQAWIRPFLTAEYLS